MQADLFESPVAYPALELATHPGEGYRQRTLINAKAADLTVAFAVDYTTGGERLTKTAAGAKFSEIPMGSDIERAAEKLIVLLRTHQVTELNVAGNGIYTMQKHGFSQARCNQWLFDVFKQALPLHPALQRVRSGGQTGADWAGLVCAYALRVPAYGFFPARYRQRNAKGAEVYWDDVSVLYAQIEQQAAALQR